MNSFIYHTDTVKCEGKEFIFSKILRLNDNNEYEKAMDYTDTNRFDYFYYKKDKNPIPENDFEHYFVNKKSAEFLKVTKSNAYKNWDNVNKDKIYNFFTPEKNYRLEKLKQLMPRTFLYRNISILYLDIELYKESDVDMFDTSIPIFQRYLNPITAIALTNQNNKTGEVKNFVYVWDKFKRNNYTNPKFEVLYFDSEKELLRAFVKFIAENNPDIYVGWNVHFDLTQLYIRIYKVLGRNFANGMSPYAQMFTNPAKIKLGVNYDNLNLAYVTEEKEEIIMNGSIVGYEYKPKIHITGVNVIDYMETMKKKDAVKSETKESYTLEHCAQEELGYGKVDYSDYGNINTLYEKNLPLFIDYNFEDTNIVFKFEDKLGYIKTLTILNSICQIQNIAQSDSPVRLWEDSVAVYNDKILDNYEFHISKKGRERDRYTYPGALDMEVSSLNSDIQYALLTYDWASLYPTTVISCNISPEKKKEIKKGFFNDIKTLSYFVFDFNETLENVKNPEKMLQDIELQIKELKSKEILKKGQESDLRLLLDKKERINTDDFKNINIETVDEIINNYEPYKKITEGIDEIDKILIYSHSDIKDYSYGITMFYKKDSMGVIPRIMYDQFNLRIKYKKLNGAMEDLLKGGIDLSKFNESVKKYGAEDFDEYKEFLKYYNSNNIKMCEIVQKFCDDLQNSLKIFLNSGYGALGNLYFKWYDKDIASSITLGARKILNELIIIVTEYLNKVMKTPDKKRIVYGATDSIFTTFSDLFTEDEIITISNKEMVERIFKFLKDCNFDSVIKDFYKKLETEIFQSYMNIWNLEMEKFSREAIFFSKKNYILKLVFKGKSFISETDGFNPILKGVKLKKTDTPAFLRAEEKQNELLDMIFKSRKLNKGLLNITSWVESLFNSYVEEGLENPYLIGGSININSEKMKEYLNADMTGVIKNHAPGQYSGIAVYNNFLKRLEQDGIDVKNFYMKNEGFNEKAVPLSMIYDGDYIKENIEFERKSKPAKKKTITMVLPRKIKLSEEVKKEITKRINFIYIFENKVLTNIQNYVKIDSELDIISELRQKEKLNVRFR